MEGPGDLLEGLLGGQLGGGRGRAREGGGGGFEGQNLICSPVLRKCDLCMFFLV